MAKKISPEISQQNWQQCTKCITLNQTIKYFNNPLIQTLAFEPHLYHCLQMESQEGHDGPVSLHWLIREIHSYQTLHYLGIGLKHKTPYKD